MPWCDDCARFWNPNSMAADGTCPTCGRNIGPATTTTTTTARIPWHFWAFVGVGGVYVGWRLIQGLAALF